MDRRSLIEGLADAQPRAADVVLYPDHPLLMRGPELLVGHNGYLTAYFVYTRGSHSPANRPEISRHLLTRLAFPRRTRVILVLDEEASTNVAGLESKDPSADAIELISPGGGVSRRETSAALETTLGAIVEDIRPFHQERFATTWALSQYLITSPPPTRGEPTHSRYFMHGDRHEPYWLHRTHDRLEADLGDVPTRQTLSQRLATMSARAVNVDYRLDDGLNGLTATLDELATGAAHLSIHRAHLYRMPPPSASFDQLKPLRAAAFAGVRSNTEWGL